MRYFMHSSVHLFILLVHLSTLLFRQSREHDMLEIFHEWIINIAAKGSSCNSTFVLFILNEEERREKLKEEEKKKKRKDGRKERESETFVGKKIVNVQLFESTGISCHITDAEFKNNFYFLFFWNYIKPLHEKQWLMHTF